MRRYVLSISLLIAAFFLSCTAGLSFSIAYPAAILVLSIRVHRTLHPYVPFQAGAIQLEFDLVSGASQGTGTHIHCIRTL